MARRCAYCEKRPQVGNKVSHSNIKTKIRNFPNLQKVRVLLNGKIQRVYACTRCLRTNRIVKPPVGRRPIVTQPEVQVS
ncbi:MAG: 50S ribosomal protein L28 [Deltaproteobacteria bacterium]|nr:50S ribosomal protein L28 [Deltaproteobacteria bacterium]